MTTGGNALCWGQNFNGKLGVGVEDDSVFTTPHPVAGGLSFAMLNAAQEGPTCGVTTTGAAHCWGSQNDVGQLGIGATDFNPHPEPVAVAPFAGLFVTPELRETSHRWYEQLRDEGGSDLYSDAFERTGISRVRFFDAVRGLYDETMAHQDRQIGELVERLKARGEWEHTLLIVAADHSTAEAGAEFGLGLLDSLPPQWSRLILRSTVSRVPLMIVWPGRIAPGQRFSQPVSMIDMLPTILDLAGLPMPEVMQGQSLAPLFLGEEGWEPRPVILDQFAVVRKTGELRGRIEVIDGPWGASLEINPDPEESPERRRPTPLLLYDLWSDPMAVHALNEERPDLVQKYTAFLEAHQALAQYFRRAGDVALTPEQLETLRALGYIQ